MPYPLPLTRTEAYLAYKAGVIQQSDLKPSLAVPRNGIDAWLAYWTGLAEDYPKREDGTPHILQEEEAYIAYLCGVLDEYPEKCLRRVGAYLRYLISARWGRPDHPLNREELYLSLLKTQVVPSGDPSSDIVIDGTAKAPFVDVKLYGDTYQQTFTGKNLIGFDTYSYEKSGITCTTSPDGTITLNGTRTGSPSGAIIFGANSPKFKLSGTFTMTIIVLSGSFSGANIGYNATNANGVQQFYQGYATDGSYTQGTLTPAQERLDATTGVNILIGSGASTFDNLKFKIQVTAGKDHDSDYEPYVGGVPSPNPDYPQAIQTVTGLQTVRVGGKNLFVPPKTGSHRGVDFTRNTDGTFNISGKATGGEALIAIFSNYIDIKNGESLSISSTSNATGLKYRVEAYRGNTWLASLINQSTTRPYKITLPAGTDRLRYAIAIDPNIEVDLTNVGFQLERGSATTYEPYRATSYPINLGKNLIDMSQTWVRGTLNSSSVEVQPNNNTILSDYIKVEPNTTYVFSQKQLGGKEVKPNVVSFFKDKENVRTGFVQVLASSPQVFTTSNDTCYIRVGYYNSTGLTLDTWLDYVSDLQLEAGATATTYAPYFTPIELCKLGTYQDYIYKDGDDWKVHKSTGNTTYDGSNDEIWSKSNSTANQLFIGRADGMSKDYSVTVVAKSDKFTYIARDIIYAQSKIGFTTQTTGDNYAAIRIGLGLDSTVTTVALFRAYLSENITTVYYPLATPTDTTITDQNLINQLNDLKQGGAEEGTTYIKVSATDPNLPAKLYVEAPKYE